MYIYIDIYIYETQNEKIHFWLLPSRPSRPSPTGSWAPNDASDYWITHGQNEQIQ